MHHRAGTPSLSWHRRLEARVTAAVSAIVAASLGALLLLTTDAVSSQSYNRASTELQIAQTAFDHQLLTRASAATRSLQLVTELPVLRAHLLDSRLAGDRDTVTAMADDYRAQLGATFLVVTDARGIWLSQPGWQDGTEHAAPLDRLVAEAREGSTPAAIVSVGSRLFLALSAPARFSEEVLGTLTAGFSIDDGLAAELARLAHSEAIVWSGDHVMATSLTREPGVEVLRAAREALAASPDRPHPLIQIGDRQFVGASFPLQPPGLRSVPGRLVVLADWQPTAAFIDRLNARFLLAGLAVFGIALAGGLALSRSISRPLRQIASAAARIAEGDLTLRLPDEGSAEAVTVAHAFNDMSEALREARERLVHDAIHDPLTQLPNRVLLMERLDRAIARRVRHPDYRFGVLFIDVDRFKHVNDGLGHAAGDHLLIGLAQRISQAVRHDDLVSRGAALRGGRTEPNTVARFGGDEFVILLDDLRDPLDAVRVAERIQHALAKPFHVADQEVFATASIGVAVCGTSHKAAGDLVRDADAAMYRAKESGGRTFAVFDDTMHRAAVARLRLETALRLALVHGEFCLWYQPIVHLPTRVVAGFEALIRWRHPERGLLLPASFLDVAEQMGIMGAIDEWVLDEACRQARAWGFGNAWRGSLTMSVNLSSKAFGLSSLVDLVGGAIASSGIAPGTLRLELTESVAVADPARTAAVLRELRALGVGVSLDDFGTGFCSLAYLQQLPVDAVKVDRSFIARLAEAGDPIAPWIVELARALRLTVVAEGPDTPDQLARLESIGCDYAQGFALAHPMSADEVGAALAQPGWSNGRMRLPETSPAFRTR